MFRQMRLERAIAWSILGAYLLLPSKTAIALSGVPDLDKVSIPNITALLLCVFVLGRRIRFLPTNWIARLLILSFIVSPFLTGLLNNQPIQSGALQIRGLAPYDALSLVVNQFIFLSPFFLARQFLASEDSHKMLLKVLVIAGLIYSIPMIFEMIKAPVLHIWIYGFFPHDFRQQFRMGGWRPVVFLVHGIWVALFAMSAAVAASYMWRTRQMLFGLPPAIVAVYLTVVFFLCKTVGAMFYAVPGIILVRFTRPRLQMRIAAFLAVLALLYPLLRGFDVIPTEPLVQAAEQHFGEERSHSLKFRFDNEARLLDHAAAKPLFGWGTWGRNLVYDEDSGANLTVTDGRWIIVIGQFGWFGYLTEFGLLTLPILLLAFRYRGKNFALPPATAALALICAFNIFDLLPNATLIPWTWLMVGSLLGYAETLSKRR